MVVIYGADTESGTQAQTRKNGLLEQKVHRILALAHVSTQPRAGYHHDAQYQQGDEANPDADDAQSSRHVPVQRLRLLACCLAYSLACGVAGTRMVAPARML